MLSGDQKSIATEVAPTSFPQAFRAQSLPRT
jgi:hypothetical protein